MARIRTIKPEFWADEKLSLLDALTRLVFIGLISMADDAGRLVDNVKLLDGMLFPATDDTCRDALEILASTERIVRYRSQSGQSLIQIANWSTHQKVDNPAKYVLPGPDSAAVVQPPVPPGVPESSRESSEDQSRVSRSDLLPTTPDLRPPTPDLLPAAVRLTVRANQGLAEHASRPQPIPRIVPTAGRTVTATEKILAAGVPLAFAESVIYELARTHQADGFVNSLNYFVAAVIREYEQSAAATDVARADKPARRSTRNGKRPTPQSFAYANPTNNPEDVKWQD